MKKLLSKHIDIPGLKRAEVAIQKFTVGECWLFFLLSAILAVSGVMLIEKLSDSFSVNVPAHGGTLTEGVIGSPRFINPILAVSDADRDLSSLVFSGLLRASADGTLVPDLAEKYEMSADGMSYTVTIRNNAKFHDNSPITADDVIFSVEKAKDPSIKSSKRAEWELVTAEKINDQVVTFHLPRPYYPFIENLTLGIIPKNLWKDENPEEFTFSLKNINPVGSGPFKIDKIVKNDKGIPTEYDLVSFSKYAPSEAYLKKIIIKLYPNEQALLDGWKRGKINSIGGISPGETRGALDAGARIEHLKLPRVYGVYLNQNQATVFAEKAVRLALDEAVDKDSLVEKVLFGFGEKLDGPLPINILPNGAIKNASSSASSTDKIQKAQAILIKAGWKLNKDTGIFEKTEKTKKGSSTKILSFSLAAPSIAELKDVAELLNETWTTLGAKVELRFYELSDLSQNVIRPRKYDALLFGQVIGRNPDLFAFWHSSQRNDPGYNIALYTNSKVDKLLDSARAASGAKEQGEIIQKIYDEIVNDLPSIFLYTPDYIYILPNKIQGFNSGSIASPSERFADITKWFIDKDRVWKIFAPDITN